MSGAEGAKALGVFSGPWALHLHGAEQNAEKIVSSLIRISGTSGILTGYIFIIMFYFNFVKMYYANKNIIRDKDTNIETDSNNCSDNSSIYFNKLTGPVQKAWDYMKWFTYIGAICGGITFILSTIINEGFYNYRAGTSTTLTILMLVFGLGGGIITLWLIIGYYCITWPKTTKPVVKTAGLDDVINTDEDKKLYAIIKPNRTIGIIMAVLYFFNILTISVSEWDEDAGIQARDAMALQGA
jgi:hypothetical protein